MTTARIAIVNRLHDAAGAAVSGFIAQLGLEAVPVAAPADAGGPAALDALDQVRGADYAVVLLPAGGLDGAAGPTASLLEIGYLFGALGRGRVCFLLPGTPSLPAALAGLVVHHPLDDADLWRLLLAREMRKAGLAIDMNRAV